MWQIKISKKIARQIRNLPPLAYTQMNLLVKDIQEAGPVRGNWPNYGKLAENRHHCHIKSGHPTYVAVWEEIENEEQTVRITYAGTHEKASY